MKTIRKLLVQAGLLMVIPTTFALTFASCQKSERQSPVRAVLPEQNSLSRAQYAFELLRFDTVSHFVQAKAITVAGLYDPWLGGPAHGIEYKSSEARILSDDQKHQFRRLFEGASIEFTPNFPWGDYSKKTIALLNEQKSATIFAEIFYISGIPSTVIMHQVCYQSDQVARLSFGNESFNYLELESRDLASFLAEFTRDE